MPGVKVVPILVFSFRVLLFQLEPDISSEMPFVTTDGIQPSLKAMGTCVQHLPFGTKNLFRLLSNPAQMQEYTRRIQQESDIRPVMTVLYSLLTLI